MMSQALIRCFIFFFIILISLGCEKNIPEPLGPQKFRSLTLEEKSLVDQSNLLAFEFLSELEKKDPKSNIFFSPLTIGMAMGMLYNGIDEQGKNQFNKIIDFTGSEAQVNKSFNELFYLLKQIDDNVKITLTNSFWHHHKYVMNNLFKDKIMAYYNAEAEGVNFENNHSSNYINRILSIKMNKDPERIKYNINKNLEALQINAVSFSGKWSFSPEIIVQDQSFNGAQKTNYELIQNAVVQVYQGNGKRLIDIPYGKGQYCMSVMIEDSLASSFSYQEFNKSFEKADTMLVDLYLPLLSINYKFNLLDLFESFNLDPVHNSIFDGTAPKQINAIVQDAYIDPPITHSLIPIVPKVEQEFSSRTLIIDKPFTYFIREKHTGIILFAGKFLYPNS